jgi:hypothetical protein
MDINCTNGLRRNKTPQAPIVKTRALTSIVKVMSLIFMTIHVTDQKSKIFKLLFLVFDLRSLTSFAQHYRPDQGDQKQQGSQFKR